MTDEYNMDDELEMSGALMVLMESVVQPILAAVAGYRASLVDIGFSDSVADEMAQDFNAILMGRVGAIVETFG